MFFRFLKHNKAYKNYIDELSTDNAISFRGYNEGNYLKSPEKFIILQTQIDPYDLISKGFRWRLTKQGSGYWKTLNHKWVCALLKLNEIVKK